MLHDVMCLHEEKPRAGQRPRCLERQLCWVFSFALQTHFDPLPYCYLPWEAHLWWLEARGHRSLWMQWGHQQGEEECHSLILPCLSPCMLALGLPVAGRCSSPGACPIGFAFIPVSRSSSSFSSTGSNSSFYSDSCTISWSPLYPAYTLIKQSVNKPSLNDPNLYAICFLLGLCLIYHLAQSFLL